MELRKLADILVDKIKRDYRDDVSLVHVHGSYAYNDTHARSDLDMYYVPKTPRGFKLGCTFILDGIGCDIWALPWERLERIAAHEERIASIITEGELLYYGTEEDLTRFEKLKKQAADTSDRKAYMTRARKALDLACKDGFLLQNAQTMPQIRIHTIGMLYHLSFALAQFNQTPIRRGRGLLKKEILDMPLVPEDFAMLYDRLFTGGEPCAIKDAAGALLQNTDKLMTVGMRTDRPTPFPNLFGGWYEEMIQHYNKIYHACKIGDVYTPLFAAVEFTQELNEMLQEAGVAPALPDMAAAYDSNDLEKIAAAARAHQAAFEALLLDNGVRSLRFSTLEEVERFLDSK
ncbi:MAG: nucleotidyltransferase domain-containing protein [Clostridiales bacterium]|nr:nucleotidyltransferase domain-containing protein [Clostridiales bacterium]